MFNVMKMVTIIPPIIQLVCMIYPIVVLIIMFRPSIVAAFRDGGLVSQEPGQTRSEEAQFGEQ